LVTAESDGRSGKSEIHRLMMLLAIRAYLTPYLDARPRKGRGRGGVSRSVRVPSAFTCRRRDQEAIRTGFSLSIQQTSRVRVSVSVYFVLDEVYSGGRERKELTVEPFALLLPVAELAMDDTLPALWDRSRGSRDDVDMVLLE
jgi:hypothetical protein